MSAGLQRGLGRVMGRVGLAVVRGRSMEPTLHDGDRLLIVHRGRVDVGALVVAHFADGTLAIKRAAEQRGLPSGEPGWWLLSDNPEQGVDSRHRGPVSATAVVGVVRARMWPSPRLGRHLNADGVVKDL